MGSAPKCQKTVGDIYIYIWMFPKIGANTPKMDGLFIMEKKPFFFEMDDLGKTPLFLETPILVPDGGVILETPCLTTMMLGKRWFGPDPFGTAFVGIFSGMQLAVKTFEGLSWIMKARSGLILELALI